ncbi:MAG: porin, partial [Elusimicrobia bacterium]|nr:porin [Elusimicrobiota bacterium]
MKSAARALLAALALAAPAAAEVKVSGYLKSIEQWSKGLLDGRPYGLNTARARLTLDEKDGPFAAHADLDAQEAVGSYFRTLDFKVFGYAPPKPWLTMEHTVSTGTTNGFGIGAYRAWVGVEDERGALRAGRQRVAWGTGKIWNPTDVLNPYSPTSVERDERRGVDALYGRAGIGTLGQAELVWAPNDR